TPDELIIYRKIVVWYEVVWIQTRPRLQRLNCFINLAGDVGEILLGDVELFPLTHPVSKFVGFLDIWLRRLDLFEIAVMNSDPCISHGKVRIEFNRSF